MCFHGLTWCCAALWLVLVTLAYLGCITAQIEPGSSVPAVTGMGEPSTEALAVSEGFTSSDTLSTSNDQHGTHTHHLAAMFKVENFTAHAFALNNAIRRINSAGILPPHVNMLGMALPAESPFDNPNSVLIYVCDAFYNNNVTSFLAIGDQKMINMLSIATQYVGVPLIAYNTDRSDTYVRGERPLLLQLDPSVSVVAHAMVTALGKNHWYYVSLIIEDVYAMDGFESTFIRLTNRRPWQIEDRIILSRDETDSELLHHLHHLLENHSRVFILHCSSKLAKAVFRAATTEGFTGEGYAWFVTQHVYTRNSAALETYPIGLLAFTIDYNANSYDDLISDGAELVARGTSRFLVDYKNRMERYVHGSGCTNTRSPLQRTMGLNFYKDLKRTEFSGRTGWLSFDEEGVRAEANIKILNLIRNDQQSEGRHQTDKRWRGAGNYKNQTLKLSTIIWPGETASGPITQGERTLRVVTNIVEPFVMEHDAPNGTNCTTSVPCLEVDTKSQAELDDIFRDFENGVYNESRHYKLKCCMGLSVMLLQRLGLDLNFRIQLYITSDRKYGNKEDGEWNGMVKDLMDGAAHMAVAAFSITRARSRVIDFTSPYFYSGFSILVSERKRKTQIHAFLEPFDSRVWISIVISATIVAVALSILEWNSPFGLNPWGRKRKTNYSLGSGLNMVYAIFFQHTIKTKSPKAWPSKWLQNFWAGASIFIYSSYTANLAAFLAGKNSGVTITGIHDPKLRGLEIGVPQGAAIEDHVRALDSIIYRRRIEINLTNAPAIAVQQLMNATIDAYLDDTPVLEYARITMDVKCQLQLVGKGFGEDGYGIALPKGSWLMKPLSQKILEYHESGYMEDLKNLYFRRSKCTDIGEDALQGEASPMNFDQHAGLYLLLLVGIVICVMLMMVEHATFKWLVPYWRRKPTNSFWKSLSMMFWSQRLYRIITSDELVSPHHSAREIMEVVKNRDFTKLFQKSVKRQERQARNRKNLFSVVEQLQWKQRRDERLSQQPSIQTDASQDSDNSATPVNLLTGARPIPLDDPAAEDTNEEDHVDDWPENWEKEWIASGDDEECITDARTLYRDGHINQSFSCQADIVKFEDDHRNHEVIPLTPLTKVTNFPIDGEVHSESSIESSAFQRHDTATTDPDSLSYIAQHPVNLLDVSLDELPGASRGYEDDKLSQRSLSHPCMPLIASDPEDNLTPGSSLPNGVLILSPTGDVFARDAHSGKSVLVRPKRVSHLKNFTANLPQSMKTLPLKDNRVKSDLLCRSRTLEQISDNSDTITNELDNEALDLECLSKEQLLFMWKNAVSHLAGQLQEALQDKAELQEKLSVYQESGT